MSKSATTQKKAVSNSYRDIVEAIFFKHYKEGATHVPFDRDDIIWAAETYEIKLPKNLGDVIYALRYRIDFPEGIISTAPAGMEWAIIGAGRAKYEFKLYPFHRLVPRADLLATKIPDATPEIISAYALDDEQALLAKVRYNRLIDIFLGVASYSLQNHLRTSVKTVGQIEIDEVYVAVDKHGRHFIIPVQAKGGTDKHGVVQTMQDQQFCAEKYPALTCRCISAQFMSDNRIAMFELTSQDGSVKVVEERHYQLVMSSKITAEDLLRYSLQS
ncbi:hypothetical protein [Telluria beijingensis]|uniref:hypothetical protein n=1 Tax=Telluria beijingensis TaxID=3068633 RepID=UPI002795BD99|nr:hypothetical protein [Massilia sp. REN29]